MSKYYYNYHSNESYSSQYRKYLQNQSYVKQLDNTILKSSDIISRQVDVVNNAIKESSGLERDAITSASNAICSSLEWGFSDLLESLGGIKSGIDELINLMGHGFDLFIQEQKITNEYLGKIEELLRIPDSQKQRVYHINEGLKFLKNALKENSESSFYEDAMDEYKKSEAIESKDYFTLFQIGFIYLQSYKFFNAETAETYFRNSAKYSIAESNIYISQKDAIIQKYATKEGSYFLEYFQKLEEIKLKYPDQYKRITIIDDDGYKVSFNHISDYDKIIESVEEKDALILAKRDSCLLKAAEAYLYAADACYIQQKYKHAVALSYEAYKIFPDLKNTRFLISKYLAANNQLQLAINMLEILIKENPYISMQVVTELELITKPGILTLLEKFREEAQNEALVNYNLCKNVIIENSIATDYLNRILDLIKLNTFLDSKKAIDLMNEEVHWSFSIVGSKFVLNNFDYTSKLIDFINYERYLIAREKELERKEEDRQFKEKEIIAEKKIKQVKKDNIKSEIVKLNNEIKFLEAENKRKSIGTIWINYFFLVFIWFIFFVLNQTWHPFELIGQIFLISTYIVVYIGGLIMFLYLFYCIKLTIEIPTKKSKNNLEIVSKKSQLDNLKAELNLF